MKKRSISKSFLLAGSLLICTFGCQSKDQSQPSNDMDQKMDHKMEKKEPDNQDGGCCYKKTTSEVNQEENKQAEPAAEAVVEQTQTPAAPSVTEVQVQTALPTVAVPEEKKAPEVSTSAPSNLNEATPAQAPAAVATQQELANPVSDNSAAPAQN